MKRLLALPVDHPLAAIAAVAACTVLFALAIPRLEIDPSAEGFMVAGDPARAYYEEVRREFGSDRLTLVVVEADDTFTTSVLAAVRRLSDALAQLDGVVRVDSLTTVRTVRATGDDIETSPLVGAEIPSDAAALDRIRREALDNPVFARHLVAADSRTTAIAIFTDPPEGDRRFNQSFVTRVDEILAREASPRLNLYQVGEPLLKATYVNSLIRDLTRLIPLSFAVLFGTVALMMRTPAGVLIPATTSAVSLVWGAGLMSLVDIPVNALTAAIPPLLVSIGVTEDVHLIATCRRRTEGHADKTGVIRAVVQELALPIAVTSVTTMVGFGSLVLSDVTMLSQFGAASALALGANFVVTMTLVPSLLRLLPAAPAAAKVRATRLHEWVQSVGWFTLRHRTGILVASAAVVALGIAGIWRLPVDTDFISYFPKDSAVPLRAKRIHERLSGSAAFYVVIETGRADGINDPQVLQGIDRLQRFIVERGGDATLSVADYLRKVHREMNAGSAAADALPPTAEHAAQYLLLLDRWDLDRLISTDGATAVVLVRHNLTGSARLRTLVQEVETFASRQLPPHVRARSTGESVLINNAADYMAVNELTSFSVAFLVIGVIHTMLFMSPVAGALSLVPNLIPVALTYGLMGFLGVPLNTGTAMIATIAIGVSVDDTVHHVVTYSRRLREDYVPSMAMFNTLSEVTPPVVYVTLALSAGFLVMLGSGFVPLRQFGVLAALTMAIALACEVLVTPALFGASKPILVWDLVHLRTDPRILRRSPLLAGLSEWQMRRVMRSASLTRVPRGQAAGGAADTADRILVLLSGRALAEGGVVLEPGSVFGRLGGDAVTAMPARVVADTPLELLEFNSAAVSKLRTSRRSASRKVFENLTALQSGPTTPPTPPGV